LKRSKSRSFASNLPPFPILNWLQNEKRLIYSSLRANAASAVGNETVTDASRPIERLSA
jgi:hypothetical protein